MIKKILYWIKYAWDRLKPWLYMILFIIFVRYFGKYGLFWLAVAIVLFFAFRIATNFDQYMTMLRHIEVKIWGQTLDKENGKPPKVKVKWKQ